MSELYPVLILKGLSWLLMARFTPYSRAVVAQMWPRGREGKATIQCLCRGRGTCLLLRFSRTAFHCLHHVQAQTARGRRPEPCGPTCTKESDSISVGHGFGD